MMAKTIFIPCRSKADIELVADNILEKVECKKIGLVTTAQFVGDLAEIKKKLEKAGRTVVISPGRPNPGQVLGCDARAAKGADCYVYIGTGRFHPLNVAMKTGKPTYMAHPSGGIERIHEELVFKHQKIHAACMHRFKEAKTVGILVSTKPGQSRMDRALALKKKLTGAKETFIFAANEIKSDYFIGYDVDAWVNTACPRIGEDAFDKPVVDISDVEKS
jgi:2-(3-amino-3-carboxypropyl)histidine synthase